MNDYNLPKDLEIFLRSGKQLDYDAEATETGEIGLKSFTYPRRPPESYSTELYKPVLQAL